MARGRMISKSWSTSKKRAALYRQYPALAEFCLELFPLLVVHSDDYGRFDGDPESVKLNCDPASPRSIEEFDQALSAMTDVGLLRRYAVDGRAWLQIVRFDEHQPGLLSKRGTAKSPAPPADPETGADSGNSVLTKPNLTKPNLTQEERSVVPAGTTTPHALSADDIVSLWNQSVTPPIPQVTKLTADRRAKINARLKTYPDLGTWRTVIAWLNRQAWCRASGTGDHPNWTATLDWLCKSDGNVQKYLEKATTREGPAYQVSDVARRHLDWDISQCPHRPEKCGAAAKCLQLQDLARLKAAGGAH